MSNLGKVAGVVGLVLATHSACVPNDGGGGGGPVSRFSKGFVFVKDDRNVYLIDQADYSRQVFNNLFKLTTQGGYSQPSLSADGSTAVFVYTDVSGNTEIDSLALGAAGASPTRLVGTDSLHRRLRNPVVSPDGRLVIFAYDGMGGSSYLGRVDVQGGTFQQLTAGVTSYGAASFYPNGDLLAIAGSASARYDRLERVSLSSPSNPTVVTNMLGGADFIVNRAVVSPDGSKAAFDGRTSGGFRIFVVNNLGNPSSITITQATDHTTSANDTFPTWVGSDQIGFASDFGAQDNIYVQAASMSRQSGGLTVPSAREPYFGPN